MTTGNITKDYRRLVTAFSQGCLTNGATSVNAGRIIKKNWTGADSGHNPKKPYKLVTFQYRVWKWNSRKAIWVPTIRRRTVRDYYTGTRVPVKENAYSCSITDFNDGVYRIVDPSTVCVNGRVVYQDVSSETYGLATNPMSKYWSSNEDLALIGKLSSKLQGDSFNMAVFLGEGREALQTIYQGATRIRRSLQDLRHGNVLHALEALVGDRKKHSRQKSRKQMSDEYVTNNWLQLQYGWKPLLSDVYNAAGHLAFLQNRPVSLTYRARKELTVPIRTVSGGVTESGAAFVGKTIKANITHINEAQLVGLLDPAALAWELMPYSFVIDWFIPIGNYLEQLNFSRSLTGTYVTSWKYRQSMYSTILRQSFARGELYYSHNTYQIGRSISSNLGVPLPTVKPWEKIASWTHAANAIALLLQLKR